MLEPELEEMIEDILHEDDGDQDGYIDYYEFKEGQRRRGEADERPYNPNNFWARTGWVVELQMIERVFVSLLLLLSASERRGRG